MFFNLTLILLFITLTPVYAENQETNEEHKVLNIYVNLDPYNKNHRKIRKALLSDWEGDWKARINPKAWRSLNSKQKDEAKKWGKKFLKKSKEVRKKVSLNLVDSAKQPSPAVKVRSKYTFWIKFPEDELWKPGKWLNFLNWLYTEQYFEKQCREYKEKCKKIHRKNIQKYWIKRRECAWNWCKNNLEKESEMSYRTLNMNDKGFTVIDYNYNANVLKKRVFTYEKIEFVPPSVIAQPPPPQLPKCPVDGFEIEDRLHKK